MASTQMIYIMCAAVAFAGASAGGAGMAGGAASAGGGGAAAAFSGGAGVKLNGSVSIHTQQ
jgi:hypothetical protein